jgi:ketosteroid isomerase-like protein
VGSPNVDLVRSIFSAWGRGDFGSVEWAHPEIEWVGGDGPDAGSRTGLARIAEVWRDVLGAWTDFRVEAEEYRELDAERVLVLAQFSARGKASGLDVEQMRSKGPVLFHFRHRTVTRFVTYWERQHALADLGLDG